MNYIVATTLLLVNMIASAHIQEQHIVVVTLMYNTGEDCIKGLSSAFAQNYGNYELIVVDDCSTNDSAQKVRQYIKDCNMEHKVRFVQNKIRCDVTANHELAVNMCKDNDIVIALDGDGDMFAHTEVLSYINRVYTIYPKTWMTYGSFITKSTGQRIFHGPLPDHVLANRTVRRYDFVTSHLRTFRAWLFKQVKHEDLLYKKEKYPRYAPEIPFVFPMIEMAGLEHVRYIDDILYIYNDHPCNTDMAEFHRIIDYFRSQPPYAPVNAPIINDKSDE